MTTESLMVSVPRELLESAARELEWHKTPGAANRAHDLRTALAAPAEDVRAAGEEPVAYADPKSFENFNNLAHLGGLYTHEWMWAQPAAGLVPLYRRPQRPVESLCSEVSPLCSEHLLTQGRQVVLPESTEIDFLIERPAK